MKIPKSLDTVHVKILASLLIDIRLKCVCDLQQHPSNERQTSFKDDSNDTYKVYTQIAVIRTLENFNQRLTNVMFN